MRKPKFTHEEKAVAVEALKKAFPKGSTAHIVLVHKSASGMSRSIVLLAVNQGEPQTAGAIYDLSWAANRLLGWGIDQTRGGVKVAGAGMDMGFHLVATLSAMLYDGNAYAISHRWL